MTSQPHLELFGGCRMVLCLPCGDGAVLDRLRELGVPAVGIDLDAACIQRCRERGLVAFCVSWQALAHHRQKFDGIHADLAALGGDLTACLDVLIEALLPGGVLVLARADGLAREVASHTRERLEPRGGVAGLQAWTRRPVAAPAELGGTAPSLVVGPYADAFAGRQRVLEIGCGAGRFLDALVVRGLACVGLEPDAELAAAARARGHEIECGGLASLRGRTGEFDGVYAGYGVSALDADGVSRLLAACRHALSPGGRLLLRAGRASALVPVAFELAARHGFEDCHVGALPADRRDRYLLAAAGDRPEGGASASAPRLEDVPIESRGSPFDAPLHSLFDLERCERRVHSQGGEDGVLAAIFERIGTTNRTYVEFGCGDGVQCNTAFLRRQGWQGLLMDGVANPGAPDAVIHAAWITAENINELLARHGVPEEPDLMSIDLDGNDYWVWRAIRRRPRVVVIEYNANVAPDQALTIAYDPGHRWNGSDYYGASLLALERLGREKGYALVYCNQAGVNAFFVRDDLIAGEPRRDVASIYRPPNYWYRGARQYPDLSRSMIPV